MTRLLLYTLTLLSFTFCATTAALWARTSHAESTSYTGNIRGHEILLEVKSDHFILAERRNLTPPPEATTRDWVTARPMTRRDWNGFGYGAGEDVERVDRFSVGQPRFVRGCSHVRYATAPAWAVAVLFALLPAAWLQRHIRGLRRIARRTHHNLCPTCNYDLRATPDRCPECGTSATANAP